MNGIIWWEFIESRGAKQVTRFDRYFTGTDEEITDELEVIRTTGRTSAPDYTLVGAASPRMGLVISNGAIEHPGYPNEEFGDIYEIHEDYAEHLITRDSLTDAYLDPLTGKINLTT